jgi:hypothetical protein
VCRDCPHFQEVAYDPPRKVAKPVYFCGLEDPPIMVDERRWEHQPILLACQRYLENLVMSQTEPKP